MRQIFYVCGLAAAILTLSVNTAHAQTVAVGPYYATPSWDQTIPCVPGNCPRFVVLSNMNSEAVLDRETGLVWQRTVGGVLGGSPASYGGAVVLCSESTTGGRGGWRVPSLHEFGSLIDVTSDNLTPALPAGHPFLGVPGPSTKYWTGTTIAGLETHAYFVLLLANVPPTAADKFNTQLRFWCVRGGGPISVS
jgi:hypothetical protein